MAERPLKILHVCPRPSFSGLEAYALEMANFQAAAGHSITFVVLAGSPLAQRCHQSGLPTLEILPGRRLRFLAQLQDLLRSSARPDVIHLHSTQDLDLLLVPLTLAKFLRPRPCVVLQTHIWISHTKRDPLHAIAYLLVDEVWCSSGPAKRELERYLPVPSRKIRVINYGRNVEAMERGFFSRAEAREKLKLPLDATVVGTVARVDQGKGTREIFEGAKPWLERDSSLRLLLVGPATADDPKAVAYDANLRAEIAALPDGLRERIHMLGQLPESYRYLKAFNLFVLATYKENFALSLLEALLAGVPSLATASGGSPEVVREGETGWLFEPRSAQSLQAALGRAFEARATWPAFGAAGEARVRRDFDTAKCLPATIAAYREILA